MKFPLFLIRICSFLFFISILNSGCSAQKSSKDSVLTLNKVIKLPGIKGRIDHMCSNDSCTVAYIAEYGNNSVEAVNLIKGNIINSIKGLDGPQGVVYLPKSNLIFVSNDGGICQFFNASTFEPVKQLNLKNDADNVRYDKKSNTIYTGYGDGAIAVINAKNLQLTGSIHLDGHPESFHLDKNRSKLWVNIAKLNLIEVVDLKNLSVEDKWSNNSLKDNFPMALDSFDNRIFVGCRSTSKLLVLNSETGNEIASLDCTDDADDIYYDYTTKMLYISAGGGYIDIIKQTNANEYKLTEHVKTREGARTSLFLNIPHQLLLAIPKMNGKEAELRLYNIK